MKLLIFGSGFLVKHIADNFISNNDQILVNYRKHKVIDLAEDFQRQMKEDNLVETLEEFRPDYILLAQGDSLVGDNAHMSTAIQNNLQTAVHVLEVISHKFLRSSIKKIVVIGSAAEYGNNHSTSIPETTPTHPRTIYGLTKIFLLNTCLFYIEKGLPIIYSRQFNSIGPYQRDVFVLSAFCKQIALIEKGLQVPIMYVGNLNAERDFIDARDAADAYRLLFLKGKIGEVYNVGSGTATKIKLLIDILMRYTRYRQEIKIAYVDPIPEKDSLADILLSDNTKLRDLNFKINFSLERTIIDTLDYWRTNV